MRRRFGRVLALILAMSLVLANASAASATDLETGVTESIVQEDVSEDIQTEEKEVLPEDIENTKMTEDSQTATVKEESEPAAEEQSTVAEENTVSNENVSEAVKELRFENEDVTVVVSEKEVGAISEGTSLKVVPITANDDTTKAQYQEVEKQIQEKVAKEEKEVAGFLAYDITLVDAQGNEVEPNSSVKVSMEYKKETIPEGLSEEKAKEANVAVYHLEEDENGKVKEVVDMGAAKQVENISATDKNEVKKLEMVTESFSSFVIVWKGREVSPTVVVKYVDTTGKEIDSAEFRNSKVELDSGKEAILSSYTPTSVVIGGSTYRHKENRVDDITSGDKVTKVRYRYSRYEYYASEEWERWSKSNKVVYLIYEKLEPLETVETVDSAAQGITMKMVNLTGDSDANIGVTNDNQINFGSNSGYGGGNIKYNLLQPVVGRDGYPRTTNKNQSLSKLFANAKTVNHLFIKDIYDKTKYYEYSSFANYAYLGSGNEFTVYKQIGTPSEDDRQFFFNRGNFMPYNRIEAGKFSKNRNLYDEDGRRLTEEDPRYDEKLYYTQGDKDYHFGMEIETEFMQPRDGKVSFGNTTKNMVYEFNGDDDLWVFIDGVLVLDIGGVHDAHSGKINFATGDVTWYDWQKDGEKKPALHNTTIREMFKKAKKLPNGSYWSDAQATKFFEGNTFKDYSEHVFQMFYLERGGGASNLHVKFNLPTIPKNTVNVEKVVKDKNGYDVNYAEDIDFKFQMELDKAIYANKAYKLFENGEEIKGDWKTDANGQFTLKHNQKAQFPEIEETSTYRVKELGAYLNGYQVKIDGTTVEIKDEDGASGGKIPTVDSGEQSVLDNSTVVFENIVDKTATLYIRKEFEPGTEGDPTKEFSMQLKLKDKLYRGSYTIGETTYRVENGIIQLKAGETARITGLPYGVTFDIQELVDGSYNPIKYEVTADSKVEEIKVPVYDENGAIINDTYSVSAKMLGDCTAIVTNKKVELGTGVTNVRVTKSWDETLGKYDLPSYVEVTLYIDTNFNGAYDEGIDKALEGYETKKLTAENSWTTEWHNLPTDIYYVIKETYPPGYELIESTQDNVFDELIQEGDRNTPNANTKFDLGKNNILLVKETANKYFLWTPIDLHLDQEDIEEVVKAIIALGLEGSGNLEPNNIDYRWGMTGSSGIHLAEKEDKSGWTLSFEKKSNWAMFWNFSYTRTQNITLKNTLKPDAKASVWVHKDWLGDTKDTRPESIKIQLYQNDIAFGNMVEMTADSSGKWNYRFDNLPIFAPINNGKYEKYVYTIGELWIGNEKVIDNTALGYKVTIAPENGVAASGDEELSKITITNTKGKPWEIYKVSSSKTEGEKLYLKDAWFELKSDSDTFYGKTDENGLLKWYIEEEHITEAKLTKMNGRFVLSETKAPDGYQKSTETWTIKLNYGNVESVVSSNGNVIKPEEVEDTYRFYYEDTPLYSLPESGGNGIYWYMVGGVLLLTVAGMLILYKNRRKEVLRS